MESKKSVVSSFDVDHITLKAGLYLRSVYTINDEFAVHSWDMRFRAPMDHAPLGAEEVHTIEAVAESVVETFYIQIKVEGLEYVSSAQAVLTGMVGSNKIGLRQRVTDKENAVYFTLVKSDDKGAPVLCNVFNTFGRIDGSKNDLWMTFDIHTIDGRVLTKEYDISHLFDTDDFKQHRWLLFEEVLVIPPPPVTPPNQTGGGFEPSVDDWSDERHEIEI